MLGGVAYGLYSNWGTVPGEPLVPDYGCTVIGQVGRIGTVIGQVGFIGTEAGQAGCC